MHHNNPRRFYLRYDLPMSALSLKRPANRLAIPLLLLLLIAVLALAREAGRDADRKRAARLAAAVASFESGRLGGPENPWGIHEDLFSFYPFSSDAYPYTEDFSSVPCADWENGGIAWSFLDDPNDWLAMVYQPLWRFCGFPESYPMKPVQKEWQPPAEWLAWKGITWPPEAIAATAIP